MAIGQSNLLQALGWAVFNSLWQLAILWVAYQFIVSVFRIRKPSQKGLLAALLLFTGFTWFTITLVVAFANNANDSYSGVLNINGNEEINSWFSTMLPVASILYLLLLILPVLNFIRNYRYVQVIRRYGLSRADVKWRVFVKKIAEQMNIRKPVYIWMSDLITSPVTIGYLKPIILLPVAAINHLNTVQVEAVLLHELSHIRRYDYFVNLLTKLIQTVLYFNPFVKAFARIIESERERSCDETVMQFQYEPHGYASALLVLEKAAHVSRHSLAMAASDGKKSEFRKRIEWIMGVHKKPSFSFQKLAGVMAGLLCFIGLNALLIMSKPVKNVLANDSLGFLTAPYEFFSDSYDKTTNAGLVSENKNSTIVSKPGPVTPVDHAHPMEGEAVPDVVDVNEKPDNGSPFSFVYNLQSFIPKLDPTQEIQVKKAIDESKRVISEFQWKEVEKEIADAMSDVEKEQVKQQYEKAMQNINWNELENRLKIAYDNIDWNKINGELNNALAQIKMDSLQQVYTTALSEASNLQEELSKLDQQGIPDTDINLKSLELNKQNLQKAIDKIRSSKAKRIIHL